MLANLKIALATRRVKQVDLAISIGISPSVLSEIVNGRRKADQPIRERIAMELDADEAWLFASRTEIPAPHTLPPA